MQPLFAIHSILKKYKLCTMIKYCDTQEDINYSDNVTGIVDKRIRIHDRFYKLKLINDHHFLDVFYFG